MNIFTLVRSSVIHISKYCSKQLISSLTCLDGQVEIFLKKCQKYGRVTVSHLSSNLKLCSVTSLFSFWQFKSEVTLPCEGNSYASLTCQCTQEVYVLQIIFAKKSLKMIPSSWPCNLYAWFAIQFCLPFNFKQSLKSFYNIVDVQNGHFCDNGKTSFYFSH